MAETTQPGAGGANAAGSPFDQLNAASVALLDPLFDPAGRDDPVALAARLAQAIGHCAHTAESVGLRGLNYLSALLVPHLQRQASAMEWPSVRERTEGWVGEIIAFCAGQIGAADSGRLLTDLLDWPGFPAVPEQFVLLIGGRLRQDAATIQRLAAEQAAIDAVDHLASATDELHPDVPTRVGRHDVPATVEQHDVLAPGERYLVATPAEQHDLAPPAAQHDVAPPAAQHDVAPSPVAASDVEPIHLEPLRFAQAPLQGAVPDAPVTAARDELEMLAEAVAGLADELRAHLDEQASAPIEPAELLDLVHDRLGHLASALQFMQMPALEAVIALIVDNVSTWIEAQPVLDGACLNALRDLLAALEGYLRAPGVASARVLVGALVPAWPQRPAADELETLVQRLAAVTLVRSRQVERRSDAIDVADLSLELPVDADPLVVDNLLRELPQLSTEFAACIERLLAHDPTAVEPAQRIAHTLKGSANTVGIRGIATLTHQLEDLLRLMGAEGDATGAPRAALLDVLVRGADCLGEMTDAVAGLGPEPLDAMVVCRQIAQWINRLVGDEDDMHAAAPADGATATRPVDSLVPGHSLTNAALDRSDADAEADVEVEDDADAEVEAEADAEADAEAEAEADAAGSRHVAPSAGARIDAPASVSEHGDLPGPGDDELLRVPGRVVDRMLDLAAEAAILLSQVQEQVALLNATRSSFRLGTERLGELSSELDRLVDGRGVSLTGRRSRGEFDALEFDDFDELHTVSRRIAESTADEKLIEQQFHRHGLALAESVGHLERVQTDLREAVMQSRMMAVASIAPRLQRAARQAARMIGKRIELTITGEQTAVDAQLLQRIVDPVAHLLRNAVDHGIEHEERRVAQGKPATGRIDLRFERDGTLLRVRCIDDGAGLDLDAIRRKGLALGLLDSAQAVTDGQIARLTLHPGFSTRDAATQVSGRGIGLDVVNRTVQALRGAVDIASTPAGGTTVTLDFPERLATTAVAVSRTPGHVLALSVRGVERVLAADGLAPDERGELRFVLEDDVVPAVSLDVALGLPAGYFARDIELARLADAGRTTARAAQVVLLVRLDDGRRVALVAPDLAQTRSVVVRPFPSWMPRRRAVDGAAVLGDGAVAPVIDLPALLAGGDPIAAPVVDLPVAGRTAPVCLVVDDSVSVRRSMQTFLQDLGFEVDAAGDGIEALALIERRVPDVAIVDLEMPRMNGVELASALRAQERTVEVPIIMITSRYSERHRAMAIDAGVDVFLTKPYSEDELAGHVRRCLERGASLG